MAIDTRTENTDRQLSFPQRYWLLLCVLAAIFSPLIVGWLNAEAHHRMYKEATEQRPVNGGSGGSTPSGGAVAPGDTARPGSVNPMTPAVHTSADTTSK